MPAFPQAEIELSFLMPSERPCVTNVLVTDKLQTEKSVPRDASEMKFYLRVTEFDRQNDSELAG